MSWPVFGGDAHEIYLALLKERCERDGLGSSDDVLARQFRLHLHRGIGYLAAPQAIRSIADLIELATGEDGGRSRRVRIGDCRVGTGIGAGGRSVGMGATHRRSRLLMPARRAARPP